MGIIPKNRLESGKRREWYLEREEYPLRKRKRERLQNFAEDYF